MNTIATTTVTSVIGRSFNTATSASPPAPARPPVRLVLRPLQAALARQLRKLADSIDQPRAAVAPGPRVFVSTRPEVRQWVMTMAPDVKAALGSESASEFEGVLHRLVYLPSAETAADFLLRVPAWRELHPSFAAYLMRQLTGARYKGFAVDDAAFYTMTEWLRGRSKSLTRLPLWPDALRLARAELCARQPYAVASRVR